MFSYHQQMLDGQHPSLSTSKGGVIAKTSKSLSERNQEINIIQMKGDIKEYSMLGIIGCKGGGMEVEKKKKLQDF